MGKTVILIDDDISLRQAIADYLSKDFTVLEASDYLEAAQYFDQPLDLAVIDYALPEISGFEILKALRAKYPDIPVIMITGYSTENIAIEALKTGVSDYIRKPFELKEMKKSIFKLLYDENGNNQPEALTGRKNFTLDYIVFYVDRHYEDRNLTLDHMAGMASMNKTTFCKIFKERFGRSFISYLNEVRIQRAAKLLGKDFSIKEIAFSSGFKSAEYFNRVFHKHYGVSPSEYRRNASISNGGDDV